MTDCWFLVIFQIWCHGWYWFALSSNWWSQATIFRAWLADWSASYIWYWMVLEFLCYIFGWSWIGQFLAAVLFLSAYDFSETSPACLFCSDIFAFDHLSHFDLTWFIQEWWYKSTKIRLSFLHDFLLSFLLESILVNIMIWWFNVCNVLLLWFVDLCSFWGKFCKWQLLSCILYNGLWGPSGECE